MKNGFRLALKYFKHCLLSLVLPTSSKQKLQALAKDELLASLNVPLSNGAEIISVVDDDEDEILDDLTSPECEDEEHNNEVISDEKKVQVEKERRDTKRMLIIEEILETEKNYISCLETLDAVSWMCILIL